MPRIAVCILFVMLTVPAYLINGLDNAQISELRAFKQCLSELERSHVRIRKEYEQEVLALQAELEAIKSNNVDGELLLHPASINSILCTIIFSFGVSSVLLLLHVLVYLRLVHRNEFLMYPPLLSSSSM